jgi:hypothetical protein
VAQTATQILESIRQTEQLAMQKIEEERKAIEEAEHIAILKAEEERIARERVDEERKAREELERRVREQVEMEWKAQEEAKRLAAQKAEEERITKEKIEVERLAEEKRLVTEKGHSERRAKEETQHLAAQKAEEERVAKADVEHKTEELAEPKVVVDSSFKEGLAQIPLATYLIMIGLSVLGPGLFTFSTIFALLASIFMIFRRKLLSNPLFIYSLLIYLVSMSLSPFVYLFYMLSGLIAILAGGSLFWSIFTPKNSTYYPAPYSTIVFALLLFLDGLDIFGVYVPFSSILVPVLGLLTAFLIFKRK